MSTENVTAHLCTPWCDPARHSDAGQQDQRCRSRMWTYETMASTPLDRDTISISVERYASRRDGDTTWAEDPATVLVDVGRRGTVDLHPSEVLTVVQRLLSAHAIADGTAVSW